MARTDARYNVTELRGLACLLLVAYHTVGVPGSGMHVADDSLYRYLTGSFELIRMPLFTFISGYVYAARPVRAGALRVFFGKKVRRLLLPFVIVSTVFYLLQTAAPGSHGNDAPEEMWRIYVFSYAHLWYLQALFLIFAAVGVADAFGLLATPRAFAPGFALALGAFFAIDTEANPWSVNEAATLLPHFLLGVAVRRFAATFRQPRVWALAPLGLAFGLAVHQASLLHLVPIQIGWKSGVALLCGMGGALTLLRVMPSSGVMRTVGEASYAIYLYHTFFTAAARIALVQLGWQADLLVFATSLGAGIAGPMVVEALAVQRPWSRVALVGRA
ncbi:acyltransferase [Azospirillum sp. TSO22-1]|uniref:acyltransferase family protein n=1 Tax=Azospirillum sp. TSO22-1 TaxID=716789 RepID=UPI000D620819|nr:acyltransferase [Azospirillum sp. TSO22-1]PWC35103.1 acyltransferase [Azospirillum sp. TSO22-1]